MEEQIKNSLVALLDAIKRADGTVISLEMGRLEGLVAEGRHALHPQLIHFLERRSYAKALMLLGGAPDIPSGACAPRRPAAPPPIFQ